MSELHVRAVEGLPEIGVGDDLAALISAAAGELGPGDVLVIAHKIVSKAEGAFVELDSVTPSAPAAAQSAMAGWMDQLCFGWKGCRTVEGRVAGLHGVSGFFASTARAVSRALRQTSR